MLSIGGIILTRKIEVLGEKTLSQCHFVTYEFHMDWPGIELAPAR